ncbi:MAG: sugar ABC transporter ATP-binding protein [Tenericutes bacterium]|nr:sugar ABC transporter ATP-binding protein [Mycoplasmatota bacterium]
MRLEMKKINKSFGPVKVLKDVDFVVENNEVHAFVGENGAGKSTLMKILTGIYSLDSGEIYLDGEMQHFKTIRDSEAKKIVIVNQELNVFGDMTVLDNLFLNKEIVNKYRKIDVGKQSVIAKEIFKLLQLDLDLSRPVRELSVGLQQMLEISKALIVDAELIVMDEPTSALTEVEIEHLFKVIKVLKKEGKSIIYISHRMKEILEICDSITILRDGVFIKRAQIKDITYDEIVSNMVGYELGGLFPDKPFVKPGQSLLKGENLSKKGKFSNIHFEVKEGEIIGFAGLMGSGRTEIMNAIFGMDPADSGKFYYKDKPVRIRSVQDAKKIHIGYVTEDRKEEGLFLDFSLNENVLFNNLTEFSKHNIVDKELTRKVSNEYLKMVNIKCRDNDQLVSELSGGNQQKVIIAKWLANKPEILILDEPTRGIDVNSKKQIYDLIFKLRELKIGFIVVSSELVELLGIADRIYVMHEGRLTGELVNKDLKDETVMKYMVGGENIEN